MKKILLALVGGAMLSLSACSYVDPHQQILAGFGKEKQTEVKAEISFAKDEYQQPVVSSDAGITTVEFTVNAAWSAALAPESDTKAEASYPDWISFEPQSGKAGVVTMTIGTTANEDYDSRTAQIVITAGSEKETITVTQAQLDAMIVADKNFELSADSDEFTVCVLSNVEDVEYTILDGASQWLKEAPRTKGLVEKGYNFSVAANDGAYRSAKIVFSSSTSGDVDVVTVSQMDGNDYLCITAVEDGFKAGLERNSTLVSAEILYSTDKISWREAGFEGSDLTFFFPEEALKAGESVYIKTKEERHLDNSHHYLSFVATSKFDASGNLMYFVDPTGESKEVGDYEFRYLFANCANLVSAADLKLPATTLAFRCYESMFSICSNLTSPPELPATTLADFCYAAMFVGCGNLASAPELPATTLAWNCYYQMFQGCKALTGVVELPATNLVESCYEYMFSGCTNLDGVAVNFVDWNADGHSTEYWMEGVKASGEFIINNDDLDINVIRGDNTIPAGWDVYGGARGPVCVKAGDDLQEAIDKAYSEVRVQGGATFAGEINIYDSNKNKKLSGGWNADFTEQSMDNLSVIDGDGSTYGIFCAADSDDEPLQGSFEVSYFEFTKCVGNKGAGIHICGGPLTVHHCYFHDNDGEKGAAIGTREGTYSSEEYIYNNIFEANTADGHGAVLGLGDGVSTSDFVKATVVSNLFINNRSEKFDGYTSLFICYKNAELNFINNTVVGNFNYRDGNDSYPGMIFRENTRNLLANNVIVGNLISDNVRPAVEESHPVFIDFGGSRSVFVNNVYQGNTCLNSQNVTSVDNKWISAGLSYSAYLSNDYQPQGAAIGMGTLSTFTPAFSDGSSASVSVQEILEKFPYDLAGNPRVVGGKVDAGCYQTR